MNAALLSRQLRDDRGGYLRHRRGIVCASMAGIGCMGLISLYQMGVIKHLPEPPLPGLDADTVDAAPDAFSHLDMGDALIGLRSDATTLGLAAAGGKQRAGSKPWVPLALAAKTSLDAWLAARRSYRQLTHHRAVCGWTLLAAAASLASAVMAMPEACSAVRRSIHRA